MPSRPPLFRSDPRADYPASLDGTSAGLRQKTAVPRVGSGCAHVSTCWARCPDGETSSSLGRVARTPIHDRGGGFRSILGSTAGCRRCGRRPRASPARARRPVSGTATAETAISSRRPFATSDWVDVTSGSAHLSPSSRRVRCHLIKSRQTSRSATSDTTGRKSDRRSGRQPQSESARRRSGPSPRRRTSPTIRITTASLEGAAPQVQRLAVNLCGP
jgi:hypothetical protein